ncbi:hypothetical protein [Trueperella pyogenes]|uniref:hypothetical protein n=1 Tax=Trueperella pyogenes TaxID=1661 RepID=UPI003DA817DF
MSCARHLLRVRVGMRRARAEEFFIESYGEFLNASRAGVASIASVAGGASHYWIGNWGFM